MELDDFRGNNPTVEAAAPDKAKEQLRHIQRLQIENNCLSQVTKNMDRKELDRNWPAKPSTLTLRKRTRAKKNLWSTRKVSEMENLAHLSNGTMLGKRISAPSLQ